MVGDNTEMERLRAEIDHIDAEIIAALGRRVVRVQRLMRIKRAALLGPRDEAREKEQAWQYGVLARVHSVPNALVQKIFALVHDFAVKEYPHDH